MRNFAMEESKAAYEFEREDASLSLSIGERFALVSNALGGLQVRLDKLEAALDLVLVPCEDDVTKAPDPGEPRPSRSQVAHWLDNLGSQVQELDTALTHLIRRVDL